MEAESKGIQAEFISKGAVYNVLFEVARGTIITFGSNPKNLGAATGIISNHFIVRGGSITWQAKCRTAQGKGKYLSPIKLISKALQKNR